LSAYRDVTKEEMLNIKKPIIGNVSLRRKNKKDLDSNLDEPTIFRIKRKRG